MTYVLCYALAGIAALVFVWAYAALCRDALRDHPTDDWSGEGNVR